MSLIGMENFVIDGSHFQAQEQVKRLEQSTEDEVQSTFSSIVGQEKKSNFKAVTTPINLKGKKRKAADLSENMTVSKISKKENQDYKDKDFYIPYTKENVFAEDG